MCKNSLRKMALPHRGRRRFTPTDIFPMLQTLFEAIIPYTQGQSLRKMALPLCGRRRFAPTGIFPMLQTLFEAIIPYTQGQSLRKMALPLCGRRRFAPTGIFPMLQTLFEAIIPHPSPLRNLFDQFHTKTKGDTPQFSRSASQNFLIYFHS